MISCKLIIIISQIMQNQLSIKLKQSLIDREYSIRLNQLLIHQHKIRKDDKTNIPTVNQPITMLPSISNTKLPLSKRHKSFSASKIGSTQSKLNQSKSNKRLVAHDKNESTHKQTLKKQKIDELITKKQGIEISSNKGVIKGKVFSFITPTKQANAQKQLQFQTQEATSKFNTQSVKKIKEKKEQAIRTRQLRKKQLKEKINDLDKDLRLIINNGKIDEQSIDNKKIMTVLHKSRQTNFQQYSQLQMKINKITIFIQKHRIVRGIVSLKKLQQLHKNIFSNYDLLLCFTNHQEISKTVKIPGLQFYTNPPNKGQILAANKIKSFFKMIVARKFYKNLKGLMRKVKIIQRFWKNCLLMRQTRKKVIQRANQRIKKHNQLQEKFKSDWNIIKTSPRVQIHVCSYSLQQFKKLTINNIWQRENSQLTRVFRAQETDLTVIYVTPFHLAEQITNYYKSLFNFHNQNIGNNIFFIVPQSLPKISQLCSLTTTASALLYSPKTIKRIRQIVGAKYAYIVPSFPSVEYINLSAELKIPLFGPKQSLAKLYSSKSGGLKLLSNVARKEKALFSCNKSVQDIHSQKELINTLAVLIYKHKQVKVWYLKIQDEINSRGLAYLNINKIAFLRQVCESGDWNGVQETEMIALIVQELTSKLQHRLKIVNKDIYSNYKQYITHFFTRGGVIEASFNITDSTNFSIGIMIEPTGDFAILGTYNKIQLGGKSINQSIKFPSKIKNINYQGIARQIYKELWVKNKFFGFFSIDFLYREENSNITAIGLDCFLNQKLSSLFIVKFCCQTNYNKDLNALVDSKNQTLSYVYCPHLTLVRLPALLTFFKNCKFQNISFDLQRKLGTFFVLLDRLENEQLSFIITQNGEEKLLKQMKKVIDFFCENYRAPKQTSDELGLLRGAVTTGLKKIEKEKVGKNNSVLVISQ